MPDTSPTAKSPTDPIEELEPGKFTRLAAEFNRVTGSILYVVDPLDIGIESPALGVPENSGSFEIFIFQERHRFPS